MLEVGQVFNKNDKVFCVLDIIDFNMKKYALFSVESDKLDYVFYEVIANEDGYNLNVVNDNKIIFELFNIIEGEKDE